MEGGSRSEINSAVHLFRIQAFIICTQTQTHTLAHTHTHTHTLARTHTHTHPISLFLHVVAGAAAVQQTMDGWAQR